MNEFTAGQRVRVTENYNPSESEEKPEYRVVGCEGTVLGNRGGFVQVELDDNPEPVTIPVWLFLTEELEAV